jgi:hypothetical protein
LPDLALVGRKQKPRSATTRLPLCLPVMLIAIYHHAYGFLLVPILLSAWLG